jgi:hypothetical protein
MSKKQPLVISNSLGVRIDVTEPQDLDYWMHALDIDEEALRNAVDAVGPDSLSIERYVTGYPSPGLRP